MGWASGVVCGGGLVACWIVVCVIASVVGDGTSGCSWRDIEREVEVLSRIGVDIWDASALGSCICASSGFKCHRNLDTTGPKRLMVVVEFQQCGAVVPSLKIVVEAHDLGTHWLDGQNDYKFDIKHYPSFDFCNFLHLESNLGLNFEGQSVVHFAEIVAQVVVTYPHEKKAVEVIGVLSASSTLLEGR
ncbi:hypothetical protein NL676_010436 [Syzygium grande]|nr:hypothetical protein NL676_010436 [Syzygium grande]